jgi:Sulfotransferase domain
MAIKVVGAGVGRTGTLSLKTGLEQLLGQPCYHMVEVFGRPDDVDRWRAAAEGRSVDWGAMLDGFGATSDFPACLFWPEILEANPDAVVVLSTRSNSAAWWASASETIFAIDGSQLPAEMADWFDMWRTVAGARFTDRWSDEDSARAAYDRHNAEVRSSVPAGRLVDWTPAHGWNPLCEALGLPVPSEPFPHLNLRVDFPTHDSIESMDDVTERLASSPRPIGEGSGPVGP